MPESFKRLSWRHALFFLIIAVMVVTLDQLSKEWIRVNVALGDSLPEVARLTIVHVQNTGAAFGLFANQAILLGIVAIIGLAVVLVFFRYLAELGFAGGICLSLIFAGALGNLIDRIRLGSVTDFLYFRLWNDVYWPAFNIADAAITIGALSLAVIAVIRLKRVDDAKSKDTAAGS
jgi:signal peptidase II